MGDNLSDVVDGDELHCLVGVHKKVVLPLIKPHAWQSQKLHGGSRTNYRVHATKHLDMRFNRALAIEMTHARDAFQYELTELGRTMIPALEGFTLRENWQTIERSREKAR